MEFNAPIPGESLTKAPGNMPFERPPEINDPEEAIQMHLTRLSRPEMTNSILDALEEEIDVVTLTNGILRSAVATGVHSIDVSLIIAPVIHEFIKTTADDAEIDYEEGLVDKEKKAKADKAISKSRTKRLIQKFREEPDEEIEAGEETIEEKEPQTTEDEPTGFLQRREA